jgi:hypothetical protein
LTYPKYCPNALAAYVKAKAAGVNLTVRPEDMKVIAKPKEKIDFELGQMIRDNRDDLLKMMLWQAASTYIEIEARDLGPQVAMERAFEVFDEYVREDLEDINSAFDDTPSKFYAMLQKAVEKAVRAAHRASRDHYVKRKEKNKEKEGTDKKEDDPGIEQMTLELS